MQVAGELGDSVQPVAEGGARLVPVQHQAGAEGELGALRLCPVQRVSFGLIVINQSTIYHHVFISDL